MIARLTAPETLFGFLIAALGVFLLATGRDILSPVVWGPALAPKIVAWGLILLGAATVLERLRVPAAIDEAADEDWTGFGWTLGAVAAFAVLAEGVGFPLAAGLMFALVARGFGSRRWGKDMLMGLVLAGAVYVVFAPGLGMQLSWGGMLESALKAR